VLRSQSSACSWYTGTLHMLDGKTGIPRTIIDIEMAAQLRTVETGNAPRFRTVACAARPHSPEIDRGGHLVPEEAA
jgi:hypothetical protein